MNKLKTISFDSVDILDPCTVCLQAKHRTSFPLSSNKASAIFDLVYCDVWGPIGKSYLWVYLFFLPLLTITLGPYRYIYCLTNHKYVLTLRIFLSKISLILPLNVFVLITRPNLLALNLSFLKMTFFTKPL